MTPDQLAADVAGMADQLADLFHAADAEAAGMILAGTRPPVDTGYLASTGTVQVDAAGGFRVVFTADYAPAVHAVNPFLARALSEQETAIVDAYVTALHQAIN